MYSHIAVVLGRDTRAYQLYPTRDWITNWNYFPRARLLLKTSSNCLATYVCIKNVRKNVRRVLIYLGGVILGCHITILLTETSMFWNVTTIIMEDHFLLCRCGDWVVCYIEFFVFNYCPINKFNLSWIILTKQTNVI